MRAHAVAREAHLQPKKGKERFEFFDTAHSSSQPIPTLTYKRKNVKKFDLSLMVYNSLQMWQQPLKLSCLYFKKK